MPKQGPAFRPTRPALRLLAIPLGLLFCVGLAVADEKLFGIACRSVHLGYAAPEGTVFVNSVRIDKSAPGTYFCVCGFNKGYFGLQELGRGGKKVAIFSIWDSEDQDDPKKVNPERRVKLIRKDEKTRVGRFGNEGTGGQSFQDIDWKIGETYRFAVKAKVDGERTEYTGLIQLPGKSDWIEMVTFSTIARGKALSGYYSFVEDFKRDRASTKNERRAHYGGGWVKGLDGKWTPLLKARFTGDGNPAMNIDAGVDGDRFFLATGGDIKNVGTPLRKSMERNPDGTKPPTLP